MTGFHYAVRASCCTTSCSGVPIATFVPGRIESVSQTFTPITAPLPITVFPPRIVAPGNKVTTTEYWADPLGHAKQVTPPGHTCANAIDARYGTATVYSGIRPVRQPPTTFVVQKYPGLSPYAGDNLMKFIYFFKRHGLQKNAYRLFHPC